MSLYDNSVAVSPVSPDKFLPRGLTAGEGLDGLRRASRNWTAWVGPVLAACLLGVVLWQLRTLGLRDIVESVPRSPLFWVAFLLHYFSGPACEWAIFRRLWGIPASGFVALVRKMINNELLLGYSGELYFYTWARRRAHLTTAPFGAIKDVAILSALTGNIVTLLLVGLAIPFVGRLDLGPHSAAILWSTAVVLAISLVIMLFRGRLFSLPANELRFSFWMQVLRIALRLGLGAWMWHIALPDVAMGWWLLLCAVRMVISRLPFIPNKDLAFAAAAVFVVGHDLQVGALLTMIAGLIAATHIVIGAALGASGLVNAEGKA